MSGRDFKMKNVKGGYYSLNWGTYERERTVKIEATKAEISWLLVTTMGPTPNPESYISHNAMQ